MSHASTLAHSKHQSWTDIPATSLINIRSRMILKHRSLSQAAANLNIPFLRFSDTINGRQNTSWIISVIQQDMNLTDDQVLACWPLLRRWPRPDLEERAMRRAG